METSTACLRARLLQALLRSRDASRSRSRPRLSSWRQRRVRATRQPLDSYHHDRDAAWRLSTLHSFRARTAKITVNLRKQKLRTTDNFAQLTPLQSLARITV